MLLQILFWISVTAVLHTYLFYPLLLKLFSKGVKGNHLVYQNNDELPAVTIIIPAYNEEAVIKEKLESVLVCDYPKDKIRILVGSDASTDQTNEIVRSLASAHSNIELVEFGGRSGKATIANKLVALSKNEIIILSDANIIFHNNTIYELVKHFKNSTIALVDSNMQHKVNKKDGIALQEKSYIRSEVAVKNAEGLLWGSMMGPFGGCFAFRKNHYCDVPSNFLVDDFYINMKILEKGGKAINELNALVYEDVSNDLSEEFRRKIRIATGNFQNLFTFFPLLFKFNGISFSFFSHKVLRWLGPLFMIAAYIACAFLSLRINCFNSISFYGYTFIGLNVLILLPVLDWILKKLNIHVFLLRLLTHFFTMNLALLIGLCRFMGGVRSGTWTPTQRNQ